jgi:hypothetical protein
VEETISLPVVVAFADHSSQSGCQLTALGDRCPAFLTGHEPYVFPLDSDTIEARWSLLPQLLLAHSLPHSPMWIEHLTHHLSVKLQAAVDCLFP